MLKSLFNLKSAFAVFILTLSVTESFSQIPKADKVHLGIIYPFSTHGKDAPAYTNNFSLHLLGGLSAAEEGFSFAGFSNIVKQDVKGVHIAGFSYHAGNKAEGLLFSGFTNTYTTAKGMQFAGFSNIAKKDIEGTQFAGFLNKAKNVSGMQFAGFTNLTDSIVKGPQFAGFINIAKDIKGSQFAGFINVARKVKGVQIAGFINIADSSDCPIALVNIIRNGEKSIGLSVDEQQTLLLTLRSGGKKLYGILGLGYNLQNDKEVYAMEAGLGAHFLNGSKFRLNTEAAAICLESFKAGEYFKSSIRVLPAYKITNKIELFAGASLNYFNTNTDEGKSLTTKYIHSWNGKESNNLQGIYAGYTGGINFIF